jgi:hypothetical protein
LTLWVFRAGPGPWGAAAGGGAVAGLFGSAVEGTIGPALGWWPRALMWFGITALTVYAAGLLWGPWPITAWGPLYAGGFTALAEAVLPPDWLRS